MSYIGNQPVIQSTEFREEYFPTASQTAFITGGFHPSAVSVTRNGVLLSESDYTKGSDNVTITLASAAVSGDVVVIRGNRSLAQGVSVSESRVEYVWQSGDTVVQLNADVIPAYTDVYLNGVKLAAADYTIDANAKTVSFTSAPAVGDVIAVVHKNETSALVALPLKDSSGAEILSESGSTVTLANVDTATIGSNALVVDSSGNVGIGTSSPSNKLTIQDASNAKIRFNYSDGTEKAFCNFEFSGFTFQLGTAGADALLLKTNNLERIRIENTGVVQISNLSANSDVQTDNFKNLISTSDARLKNDLGVINDSAINVIQQIVPKYFSWKHDESNSQQLGFFAQDIYPVLPEAAPRALKYIEVGKDENDEPILEQVLDEEGNPDYEWGFANRPIIAMCVKAIQEQQAFIESQQSQIDALTARIEALEATP